MQIGLISDTHDRLPAIGTALKYFKERGIGVLIHPGDVVSPFAAKVLAEFDGRLYVTYGNNDGERRGLKAVLPQIQDGPLFVELGGRRILVHHYIDWCRRKDIARADVIVTGHTHNLHVERRDGKLFVNPGEACGWLTGRCQIAVLDLETGEVAPVELKVGED